MYILGIDTSTTTGSVAVITETHLLAEYTINAKTTHAERLMVSIDAMLQAIPLDIHEIDAIAVSIGPGSFTGLRIGVTTAKGLAYSLHTPLVGVHSLDGLASQFLFSQQLLCPILDARKQQVYTAFYRNSGATVRRLSDYAVIAPQHVLQDIREPVLFLGDGVNKYRQEIEHTLGKLAMFADAAHLLPRASLIAALGYQRLQRGECDDHFALTPFYLRKSDAEIHWEHAHTTRP